MMETVTIMMEAVKSRERKVDTAESETGGSER